MKRYKRFAGALLAVLAALLLPAQALAAGALAPDQAVNLTISNSDHGVPLSGAAFSIYLVAVMDETGALTPTEAFSQFDVDIHGKNDAAWNALTSTLAAYAAGAEPTDSGTTDAWGQLTFPTQGKTLVQGLYLVLGARHTQGGLTYDAQPFLVLLPSFDKEADEWEYHVTAKPKHESRPEPGDGDTVSRRVLKVWRDEGHEAERPQTVTVRLLRDGVAFDTVTLSAANGWGYTWEGLDARHVWSVVEAVPAGYTVQITREGITFVVVNTFLSDEPAPTPPPDGPDGPDEPTPPPDGPNGPTPTDTPDTPDQPSLPQTGQLWWPVPLLLALGLACLTAGLLRRRRAGNEE